MHVDIVEKKEYIINKCLLYLDSIYIIRVHALYHIFEAPIH